MVEILYPVFSRLNSHTKLLFTDVRPDCIANIEFSLLLFPHSMTSFSCGLEVLLPRIHSVTISLIAAVCVYRLIETIVEIRAVRRRWHCASWNPFNYVEIYSRASYYECPIVRVTCFTSRHPWVFLYRTTTHHAQWKGKERQDIALPAISNNSKKYHVLDLPRSSHICIIDFTPSWI